MRRDFSNEIITRYLSSDPEATCRNVTFQVTDDCCLKCSYCYQIHKGHRMMTKEIAHKIIDLIFALYDKNDKNAVINHHTKGIVLDFIGGEPFMNIAVIEDTVEYFMDQCYQKDHIWLTNFRVSLSSNGIMYFDPAVQHFLDKYEDFISLNITIDGPKEVHDLCRVDYNGDGSFDRAIAAWNDWLTKRNMKQIETKVTIAPENLDLIETIFNFFFERGCTIINANPIFEHKWTVDEAAKYYKILIKLADRLLKTEGAESSLFTQYKANPLLSTDTNNWCGGTSLMLAFDPDGNAYPCLRYMESSLGSDRKPIIIGNVDGIYNTPEYQAIYEDMKKVTRQSQSTEECINCPVAQGCAWCSAWNYQETGSYNKRSTNICWMHRAEALANVYYWNHYYRNHNKSQRQPLYLPRDIATKLISNEEYDKLYVLSQYDGGY